MPETGIIREALSPPLLSTSESLFPGRVEGERAGPGRRGRRARSVLLATLIWGASPAACASQSLSGQVVDAATGMGIDRIQVRWGAAVDTTRSGGRFRVESSGVGRFVIDGASRGYSVYLLEVLELGHDSQIRIPLIPLGPLKSRYYRDFLNMFKLLTGTGEPSRRAQEDVSISYESSPRSTALRRWNSLPIRIYVPAREGEAFAWDALVWEAVERWETDTGLDLFEAADPERAQVTVRYSGERSRVVFERAGPAGIPLAATLWLSPSMTDAGIVRSCAEHELGHVLMLLVHSEDPRHLMYWGGSAGHEVTADEALLVRCLYGMPNLTDMTPYREEIPPSARLLEKKRVLTVVLVQLLLALFVVLGAH